MKPKVLVTGATGFLGSHLLSFLSRRGERVRALARVATPELLRHEVEVVEGSLLDPDAVARAVEGVEKIYHCAGMVSRDPEVAPEMYRLHVDGTRLLFDAAKEAGVARILLVSTSGTVAVTEDGETIPDETAPYPLEIVRRWPYYLSKVFQEKLALELAASGGPEVVIVCPSLLLGPGDARLSSSGDVLRFLEGKIPVVPSGGINFVDARDAAAGAILAMESGKAGQRYLLGGPNWSLGEFFERLARISGKRPPRLRVPDPAARLGAGLIERLHRWSGREGQPPIDEASVQIAQHFWYCDSSRARRELGWEARDPMECLDDTVAWLRWRYLGGPPPVPKAPTFLENVVSQPKEPASAPKRRSGGGRRSRVN